MHILKGIVWEDGAFPSFLNFAQFLSMHIDNEIRCSASKHRASKLDLTLHYFEMIFAVLEYFCANLITKAEIIFSQD